jgi:hypothetical protein
VSEIKTTWSRNHGRFDFSYGQLSFVGTFLLVLFLFLTDSSHLDKSNGLQLRPPAFSLWTANLRDYPHAQPPTSYDDDWLRLVHQKRFRCMIRSDPRKNGDSMIDRSKIDSDDTIAVYLSRPQFHMHQINLIDFLSLSHGEDEKTYGIDTYDYALAMPMTLDMIQRFFSRSISLAANGSLWIPMSQLTEQDQVELQCNILTSAEYLPDRFEFLSCARRAGYLSDERSIHAYHRYLMDVQAQLLPGISYIRLISQLALVYFTSSRCCGACGFQV